MDKHQVFPDKDIFHPACVRPKLLLARPGSFLLSFPYRNIAISGSAEKDVPPGVVVQREYR
jgi:hypothetical protein